MGSQATESTRMIEFLAWAESNKMKLLVGSAIVALVIGGYAIYQWHHNEAEAEASAALLKVEQPGARAEAGAEPDARAFLQVASAHPGTGAAGRALLFAADAYFRESKYPDAKTQFENFLRDYSDNPLAPTAGLGVAVCLDSMNNTNGALAAYQDVVNRFAGTIVVAQARLGLARLYEARNDFAPALRIYDELTRGGAQSGWSSEAAMRREQLLSKHPELTKTNAPLSSVTVSNPPSATLPQLLATNQAPARPANAK
jgi:predicted negative regulator of RcsB-dependent stress response